MLNNPYQKYKNIQYETATQEQLLLMLYNGAIKFGQQARQGLVDKKVELANNNLKRVQAIINELMVTLDMERGGEIANNLYNLYDYINRRLIQANIRKDPEIVDEVLDLLVDLKETWEEAIRQLKQGQGQKIGGLNFEG
ncbi:MAG: flagellar secretion chaperone FliS [Halanaerobiales bacterium]|nr:flagellar secretion chaperone FliS [Halanaerobiales bacterium]